MNNSESREAGHLRSEPWPDQEQGEGHKHPYIVALVITHWAKRFDG